MLLHASKPLKIRLGISQKSILNQVKLFLTPGTNTLKPWMEILDIHRLPRAIYGSFMEIPGVMLIETAQNMAEIVEEFVPDSMDLLVSAL